MQQRNTTLVKFKLSAIVLVSFVFLFGAVVFVLANHQQCKVGVFQWNTEGHCDNPIPYTDTGGSGLATCQYQVINFGESLVEANWVDALGACSGESATLRTNDIAIGSTGGCSQEGINECEIYKRSTDNVGNQSLETREARLDIDYNAPVTEITCNGGACSGDDWYNTDVDIVLSTPPTPTDRSPDTILECHTSSTCTPAPKNTGSPAASYSFTLSAEGTTPVRYNANDAAGHSETIKSQQIKIDKTAPVVDSFSINDKVHPATVVTSSQISLDWSVLLPEKGGSGINHYEVWRTRIDGDPNSWGTVPLIPNATSGNTDNPTNGTWWYGIHAIDNAENCIDETGSHACGGITSDAYDTTPLGPRDVLGPIKVTVVNNVSPLVFVVASPATVTEPDGWQNENAIASVSCTPAVGGADCDSSTYRLQIYASGGICPSSPGDYAQYTLENSESISSHVWVCAAAKDLAGNTGFSTNRVEFMVEKTKSEIHAFEVDPKIPAWVNASTTNVVISFEVSDEGWSELQDVEVWRENPAGHDPVGWNPIGTVSLILKPGSNTHYLGSFPDAASNLLDGKTYQYGIHVNDKAGNMRTEDDNSPPDPYTGGPLSVQVDKTKPLKPTCSPGTNTYVDLVTVSCEAEDDAVILYSVNGSSEVTYTSPFTFTQTTTLTVTTEDVAGNRSLTPDNSYVYTITVSDDGDGSPPPLPPPDTTAPVLTVVTPVSSPTSDTTPNFTFSSTEAGTITYGGDCSSSTTTAVAGNNTVTFNTLAEGLHDNCTITVTDSAGNPSTTLDINSFTIVAEDPPPPPSAENQPPEIQGEVSALPNPIKANAGITFTVNWSDPDAEERVKLYVCKDVLLATSCNAQDSWCENALFTTSNPATCTYTTNTSDEVNNTYNAYICDDQATCSSAKAGSFDVDATAPTILDFDVNPKKSDGLWVSTADPNVTINWHVKDDGASDSGLQEVQVWRSSNGGIDWAQISGSPFVAPSNDWTGFGIDSPASGEYLYGMHVKDNVGNEITETEAGFSLIAVQVDKDDPTSLVDAPTAFWLRSSAQLQSFLQTSDEDLDSGIDTSQCTFEVCSFEPNETEHCKGTESRSCNITGNTEEIFVGPGAAHCDFQGRNACDIFVDATDEAGNTGGSFESYHVDWEFPEVGKLYITATEGEQVYPILVAENSPVTYKIHVTDTVEINFCNLFIDNILEQGFVLPSGGCTQDCVVEFENVQLPDPGGDHTYSNNFAVCFDSSLQGSQGQTVDIVVETLSIILSADPVAGSINTKFDLSSKISGTAAGNANFKFDCTNDAAWEYEIDGIDLSLSDPGWVMRQGEQTKITAPDTFAVKDLCQYPSPSIYTANALVERGISRAQSTVFIDIDINNPPQAINLQDNNSTADYCFVSSPPITLSWTFFDADPGDSQSAYQVQVATNPGFGSLIIDTGKVQSANSEYAPLGLSFATTYYWRVKVWDNLDRQSTPEWATGSSFATPPHGYPSPNFTWSPSFPSAEEEVTFQDTTTFALGSTNQSWSWDFGDTGASTLQNPTHIYQENGAYAVTLIATDDAGSCQAQKTVNVTLPFPEWQEISPF